MLRLFITGILCCLCVSTGAYLTFYTCLFCGIRDIILQIKAENIDAAILAWSIVKVIFFTVPFGLSYVLSITILYLFYGERFDAGYWRRSR